MKKWYACVISAIMLLLVGCQSNTAVDTEAVFRAEILEIHENSVLVLALEGEDIRRTSDKISFSTDGLTDIGAEVGDTVVVTFSGEVMESYPAQVVALGWSILEKATSPDAKETVPPTPDAAASKIVEYNADGVHMRIELPASWAYSEGTQNEVTDGISFWPERDPSWIAALEYYPSGIAICGTGVTFTEMTFANGLTATACTETIGDDYSFLLIYDEPNNKYTVSAMIPLEFWPAYEAEIMAILETVEIG